MKIGTFTTTNSKGQIVIPKEMRDALGINSQVTLNLMLIGNAICIYPVTEFITKMESESTYSQLLKKTKGAWGSDEDGTKAKRAQIELDASKSRKKTW